MLPHIQRLTVLRYLLLFGAAMVARSGKAQCTNYIIEMPDDPNASEISWNLVDQFGVTWISGGAPFGPVTICLPDGCYTLLMFDSGGDGWDGLDWDIEEEAGGWDDHTTLNNGSQDFEQFELGNGDCNIGGGNNCTGGQNPYYINSDPGASPGQMSWTLSLNSVTISGGGSNTNDTLCLDPTCLVLVMNDTGNNGWQGGSITITDDTGLIVYTGTLASGATGTVNISIDGGSCANPGGGGPGGGGPGGGGTLPGTGPGGGCGPLPPGGDCATAGCACDPYQFTITPSGFGNVNEVPAPGSVSNPSFFSGGPWGGTAPFGCLLAGELNSSWIMFTVATAGSLQFAFGAGGQQVGFYDWEMWPLNGAATCNGIASNTLPPVRCVWNATTVGGTGLANPVPPAGDPGNYAPPLAVAAGDQFIICLSNWSFVNATVTLDFFGSAGIACGVTVLPVEMLYFNAFNVEATVRNEWSTASESNNDHFEVERSTEGEVWYRIGNVMGAGNSQTRTDYAFIDTAPLDGQSYYRLKQVDVGGVFTYSSVVAVYRNAPEVVSVWPQPSQGTFHVDGFSGTPLLFDPLGEQVAITVRRTSDNELEITMPNAAIGSYILLDGERSIPLARVVVVQ